MDLRDKNGNVITQPLTGYELSLLAGTDVLLSIEYLPDVLSLATNAPPQRVQLLLKPHIALELAEKLKRAGDLGLQTPPGTKLQ